MTRNNSYVLIIGILLIFIMDSCRKKDDTLRIAVSYVKGEKSENNYLKWIGALAPDAKIYAMNCISEDSLNLVFKKCHGLLLTGGSDIYPGLYGKESDTSRCGEFDLARDSLELKLIKMALNREIPIMGICRGHQLLNVSLGGSLYVDIPTDVSSRVLHQCDDWENCNHQVLIFPNSLLNKISGIDKGMVNSNHHQAIDKPGKGLRVLAVAEDGLIESVSWADTLRKPFLLGVQWHPERMDTTSMLSKPLAERFIKEARLLMN
ncbi:MAG TPA: gamma-glutamyl-gamma-aminobutyrate hydrolase family protein [Bacteroidales bacterium]|nr:gamma-glutamyl-gamma-aminobutyrate hydrolase family protein [Bacteroidales bacterium]HPR57419.1 gamma-glutamyl-gamma-aminobutyrate hydrolase family protein [Bacteroidales bacterium]HRW97140.1 gamma-glutamyl-gamma-aminobutyrate hydrolase family protein [Bacteroidales bacterium]